MSGVVNYAPKLFADLLIIGDRVVGQLKSYFLCHSWHKIGHKNSIFWPRKRWFDARNAESRAAKNAIKWPRVQKLGITWPKVHIWQTVFIRFSSAFSVGLPIICSGLFADLSVKIDWTNRAIGQLMAAAKLCRESHEL